ncbi:unnamed protein product [Echinostoma caproni]|uniref:Pleckstrin homology-like domain family B member 2 n=1 Tax=Echinostoma caproni TaxID=27848 RepID=A0A183ACX9_9TREM|nr:unnamed protein product [Echinostoma caproni]
MTQRSRAVLLNKTSKTDDFVQSNERDLLTEESSLRISRENPHSGHSHPVNSTMWSQMGSTILVRQDPRLHRSSINGTENPDQMTQSERDCILRNLMQYLTNSGTNNSVSTVSTSARTSVMSSGLEHGASMPVSSIAPHSQSDGGNVAKRPGSEILQRLHAVVNEAYEHAQNDENLTAILNSLLAYKSADKDTLHIPTNKYVHPTSRGETLRNQSEFDCRPFLGPKTPPSPSAKLRDDASGRSIQRLPDTRKPVNSTALVSQETCSCCRDQRTRRNRITQGVDVYEASKSDRTDPRCCQSPVGQIELKTHRESHESARDSETISCSEKRMHWSDNCPSDLSPTKLDRSRRSVEMLMSKSDRKDRSRDICTCAVCIPNARIFSDPNDQCISDIRETQSHKARLNEQWPVSPDYDLSTTRHHRSLSESTMNETIYVPESRTNRTFLELSYRKETRMGHLKRHSRMFNSHSRHMESHRSRSRSPCIMDPHRNRRLRENVRSTHAHCETRGARKLLKSEMQHRSHESDAFHSKHFSPYTDIDRNMTRSRKLQSAFCRHLDPSDVPIRFHAACSTTSYRRRSPDVRTSRQGLKRCNVRPHRTTRSNHYCGPPSPYTVVRSYRASSVNSNSPKCPSPPHHEPVTLSRYSNLERLQTKSSVHSNQISHSPTITQSVDQNARDSISLTDPNVWLGFGHSAKLPSVVSTCTVQQNLVSKDVGATKKKARKGSRGVETLNSIPFQDSNQNCAEDQTQKTVDSTDYTVQIVSDGSSHPNDFATVPTERRSVSASSSRSSCCSTSSQTSTSESTESEESSSSSASSSGGSATESNPSRAASITDRSVPIFPGVTTSDPMEPRPSDSDQPEPSISHSLEPSIVEHEEVILSSPAEPSIQIAVETTWEDGQGPEMETDYIQSDVNDHSPEVKTNSVKLIEAAPVIFSDTDHVLLQESPTREDSSVAEIHSSVLESQTHRLVTINQQVQQSSPGTEIPRMTDPPPKTITETHGSAEEEGEVFSDGTSDVDENQPLLKSCTKVSYDLNENEHTVTEAPHRAKRPRSPKSEELMHLREVKNELKRQKACKPRRSPVMSVDKFKAPAAPKPVSDLLGVYNPAHPNINFTLEEEINRMIGMGAAEVFSWKSTWSGQYCHLRRFVSLKRKI